MLMGFLILSIGGCGVGCFMVGGCHPLLLIIIIPLHNILAIISLVDTLLEGHVIQPVLIHIGMKHVVECIVIIIS